jgi:hypothetical protein
VPNDARGSDAGSQRFGDDADPDSSPLDGIRGRFRLLLSGCCRGCGLSSSPAYGGKKLYPKIAALCPSVQRVVERTGCKTAGSGVCVAVDAQLS